MKWKISLAFVGFMVITGSANAEWQYTQWGMTPEQVVSASAGKARLLTQEQLDKNRERWRQNKLKSDPNFKFPDTDRDLVITLAEADVNIIGNDYVAKLDFKNRRLMRVSISIDSKCSAVTISDIAGQLSAKYGTAVYDGRKMEYLSEKIWSTETKKTQIKLQIYDLIDTCLLYYEPAFSEL